MAAANRKVAFWFSASVGLYVAHVLLEFCYTNIPDLLIRASGYAVQFMIVCDVWFMVPGWQVGKKVTCWQDIVYTVVIIIYRVIRINMIRILSWPPFQVMDFNHKKDSLSATRLSNPCLKITLSYCMVLNTECKVNIKDIYTLN